jgi:release factor glutamine methyltransferase
MNVAQALAAASKLGIERLDGQLLLLHALGRSENDRGWLLAHDTDEISQAHETRFLADCERRASGEPLAYIVGHKEFHGLDLVVDKRVLIPRPDTETLADWAIEIATALDKPRVMDLGTGSGAIALAIKKACPHAEVTATDISAEALSVAQANAKRLSLDIALSCTSWLDGIEGSFDLIVSNPPYIADHDEHLPALGHEPVSALTSGPHGMNDLRAIVRQAPAHLPEGGWLILEHGWDQAAKVRDLLQAAGFGYVASRRDIAGIERVSGGQWLELG